MVHLDALQEKYGAKGLKVLAITNETRDKVDAFVDSTSAKHAIVIESSDSAEAFGIKGFPTAYLVGPNGKIAVASNPSEAQIEEALASVRLAPELPKAFETVTPLIKKEKFTDARAKMVKLLEAPTLAADDKTAGDALVKWIDWLAQSGLDQAKSSGEKGDWYEASVALAETSKAFKGLPQAVEADAQLKALLADKAKKDEIAAAKKFLNAKTQQRDKDMKPKEALPLFKAVASKYEGTKYGKKAKQIADELEREVAAK